MYIVLSVYLLTLIPRYPQNRGSSPIRHKVNLIQLKTLELELDFAKYIEHSDVRIADLCWAPYIPSRRITSYLRQLALSILTCSPNTSFLALLVSKNSRSLEKFELGALYSQPPIRKQFLQVSEFLSIASSASDLTF